MIKNIVFLIFSSVFLSGCFAESMTLVSTGAGASQGRLVQSSLSSAVSYGIKKTTGKFPIEHVIIKKTKKIAKKTSEMERKLIQKTKTKITSSGEKVRPLKNNIENQVIKLNNNLGKFKTFAAENFQHKPRFSYKAR
tara:strand:+ start:74 stop:484 length:411 start_codon:yes stop_codon:yes gene_type:complete